MLLIHKNGLFIMLLLNSLQLGESISYIARINNVSRSTVYRINRRTLG